MCGRVINRRNCNSTPYVRLATPAPIVQLAALVFTPLLPISHMSLTRYRFSVSAAAMFAWALVCFFGAASRASAQLILHVNPVNETFWFTGSDTGSRDNSGFPEIQWITSSNGTGIPGVLHEVSGAFTTLPGFVSPPTMQEGANGFDLRFGVYSFTSFAITGSGVAFDYSGYNAGAKLYFNSASTIPLNFGSGFHEITVMQSAIPEPSTCALVCGAGALAGTVIFRRRKKTLAPAVNEGAVP